MFLKNIEILGFKSFPDRVRLELNMGVTAIVGPNGSGKSNISDAVRWVLGEQSAKSLRGNKMEDVIFSGTAYRKPAGFAEVTLILDNRDLGFSIPFSELSVTRRIYRSGDSEYLINKNHCRLKDVHELFYDTGIGKEGYTIIGQGKVDEILNNKPEDRRGIFEEAAGIMKYRVKKQEAQRKLDATAQNILRIKDIIGELEIQLEILKVQEETAKKYLQMKEELKTIEVKSFVANIEKFEREIKKHEEDFAYEREALITAEQEKEQLDQEYLQKNERSLFLEEKLQTINEELRVIEADSLNQENNIKLNDEKAERFRENIERLEREIREARMKREERERELRIQEKKNGYLEKECLRFQTMLEERRAAYEELIATLSASDRMIEELKQQAMTRRDALYESKSVLSGLKAEITGFERTLTTIGRNIESLILETDQERLEQDELMETQAALDFKIRKLQEQLTAKAEHRAVIAAKARETEQRLESALRDREAKKTRLKILTDLENNLEGFHNSVKRVLMQCRMSPEFARGIHGAVASLIVVPKELETAISIALGAAQQNIVVDDESTAKKAVEYLKKTSGGRATFLPISSVKAQKLDDKTVRELDGKEGFIGIASDLIGYQPEFDRPMQQLLGRTVIADTLDHAITLARRFRYSFRIVTLDGGFLTTGGAITGGSVDTHETGLLSRQREIPELKELIGEAEGVCQKIARERKHENTELERLTAEYGELETGRNAVRLEAVSIQEKTAVAAEKVKTLESKRELYEIEKTEAIKAKKELHERMMRLEVDCEAAARRIDELEQEISVHHEKNKAEQGARDELLADISDYNVSVASITEGNKAVLDNIARLKAELDDSERGASRKQAEIEKSRKETERLKLDNEALLVNIQKDAQQMQGKSLLITGFNEERSALREELLDISAQVAARNERFVDLQREMNRFEVRIAKCGSDLENTRNKLWEDYELTYHNAKALVEKHGQRAAGDSAQRITKLKEDIKELGFVNVLAIDEYAETKTRYGKMTFQLNDLEEADEKLRKMIEQMQGEMRKSFQEQFILINQNFSIVFRELFGGGQARLVLTGDGDILDSGVDIEIQLPGKKMQNMMLYSGGERAMTAIALIFAMLRLKPAPFCFLDEIESSLDEANLERFVQYIRKYCENTQFIMVTHRKGTMENSNVLYGVTMQERGVSGVVSLKLGEVNKVG